MGDALPIFPEPVAQAYEAVKTVLCQSPRLFGHQVTNWRLEDISQTISWMQNITKVGCHYILKRLGFSRRQAQIFVRSPDILFRRKMQVISQAFAHSLWYPNEAVILFEDEMSIYQKPQTAKKWAVQGGAAQFVPGALSNRLSRVGAVLNGVTGQVLYSLGDKFGIQQMQTLYASVRQEYAQPYIYMVQDNSHRLHNHPKVLAAAKAVRVQPLFLPYYASWLNPIEKLWLWVRADILDNHPWGSDTTTLRWYLADFLDRFENGSDELLRYIGLLPD